MKIFLRILLVCVLGLTALPSHAQVSRLGVEALRRGFMLDMRNSFFNPRNLEPALKEHLARAAYSPLPADLQKSVFTITDIDPIARGKYLPPVGTAFLLETSYNGKKELWGVSAGHYSFKKPIMHYGNDQYALISFEAVGAYGMTDVSLFRIPTSVLRDLKPLKLADTTPQQGDNLSSAGYFQKQFHLENNRVVTLINPQRLITQLEIPSYANRTGACGSPILNKNGEVVGVHIGSSFDNQLGFAVPLNRIKQLLNAYHNGGNAFEELRFNGKKIGTINVTQYIFDISLFEGERFLENIQTYHHESKIDYSHLEQWVQNPQADKVIFEIHEYTLKPDDQGKSFRLTLIKHDLKSGKVFISHDRANWQLVGDEK